METFLKEIECDKQPYSRFTDEAGLLRVIGGRLREHIKMTYVPVPLRRQIELSRMTLQSASPFEPEPVGWLPWIPTSRAT